jgi:nicotinamide-nucleotide amidase
MSATLDPALPDDVLAAAETALELAHRGKLTLTTAESCTGGLLAALLTDVPGRSHVFERGFVVYSEDAKCDMLGIARSDVARFGAVSAEVARAMALGALRRSRADVALSITGFAGPAGPEDEEGLVHFAWARRGGTVSEREEHFGPIGRQGVRLAALRVALVELTHTLDV